MIDRHSQVFYGYAGGSSTQYAVPPTPPAVQYGPTYPPQTVVVAEPARLIGAPLLGGRRLYRDSYGRLRRDW